MAGDPFRFQEHGDPWLGVYAQPSEPASLAPGFSRVAHNMTLRGGMPHTRPGRRKLNGALFGDGARTMWGMEVWRATPDLILVASGTKLQSMIVSGGDPTDLTTAYPSGFGARTGGLTTMVQLGGRMFIVNGIDENLKWNGTNLTRMGQIAPTALAAPTKSAGALSGTFNYQARLVSSAANGSTESEPTATLSVIYSSQQGSFTAPTVPNTDPQVDRWFLYRAAQGGSTFFRVNSTAVTLATAVSDNITDDVLVAGHVAYADSANGKSGADAPPPGKFTVLTQHQGRLAGVIATAPNRLYFSDLGLDVAGIFFKPESWPATNFIDFGDQGGTQMTAVVSFFDWLIVVQDFGVWSIEGDLANAATRTIAPILVGPDKRGVGVSARGNIVAAENHLYFAAKDGEYRLVKDSTFNARVRPEKVSQHIDSLYQQIDFSQGGSALYDRDGRRFVLFGKGKV